MKPIIWQCDTCGGKYRTEDAATKCEALQLDSPICGVGDIVLARSGFGWYDGDRRWVANADEVDPQQLGHPHGQRGIACPNGEGNCFGSCCTFEFYYVVTAIDFCANDYTSDSAVSHRWRYHLATKAMSGKQGYERGWTATEGHFTPTKVEEPPEWIFTDSGSLIGIKAEHLL